MHSFTSRLRHPVIGVSNNNTRADEAIDGTPAAVGKSAFRAGAAAARLRRGSGFTLVELMITLTVAVILIIVAVPSFKTIILSNKLTATANDVVSALNLARTEAVKRNGSTQLCSDSATSNTSDTLGAACATHVGAVYVLTGNTATQVRSETVGLTTPLQLSGSAVAVRFSGDGLGHAVGNTALYSGTVMTVCTASLTTDNRRLIALTAGSIVDVTTKTGTCP